MRKNAPRKWLHAILDLLPVILIPVFMIYSHRHTIDSGSIDVPQNIAVDFNQQLRNNHVPFTSSNDYWTYENVESSLAQENRLLTFDSDSVGFYYQVPNYVNNHKYLLNLTYYSFSSTNDVVIRFYLGQATQYDFSILNGNNKFESIITSNGDTNGMIGILSNGVSSQYMIAFSSINLFDLTQMFGVGNEPTIEQFNIWFPNAYYDYTLSEKQLLKDTSTITFDDTDIMSQSMYQLYNSVDKYFNMNNIFNMNAVYDWFVLNVFNGNAPIVMYVVWNIALYELVMDLMFLLYALFMWFVDWCKSLIERTYDVGRGK